MDVADRLRALGLGQYEAAFRENAVIATLLPNLTAGDLEDLGVALVGHRHQILDAIAALRLEDAPVSADYRSAHRSARPATSARLRPPPRAAPQRDVLRSDRFYRPLRTGRR